MTLWRPAYELRGAYQPWWVSAMSYGAGGIAKGMIAKHLGGLLFENPANDRDHIRW